MVLALELQQSHAVFIGLEGELHILPEELIVPLPHGFKQLHVLHAAVHHRAAVGRDDAVGKIEAALNGALEQGAARLAQEACHIVGRNVHRAGVRRGQADGKHAVKIHKRLGRVLAHEGGADFAFVFCLGDQGVVCLLEEAFKEAKVLQVSHRVPPKLLFLPIHPFRIVNIISLYTSIFNLNIQFIHICLNQHREFVSISQSNICFIQFN